MVAGYHAFMVGVCNRINSDGTYRMGDTMTNITESDGITGGQKFDYDKAPVVQGCLAYFPRAIKAVAFVSRYGATKYGVPYSDKNWERVEDGENRYEAALVRHLLSIHEEGVEFDEESGMLHKAHLAWNALATLELALRRREEERGDGAV